MKKIKLNAKLKKKILRWLKIFGSIFVGLSSILAAWFAYNALNISKQSLDLQEQQVAKNATPFFKYRYSEENKAFVVESEEDVSIHSITWFLPYTEKKINTFTKNSNILKIEEIVFNLEWAIHERKILLFNTKSFGYIKCNILASFDEYQINNEKNHGFPVATLINYTRKGDSIKEYLDLLIINEFEDITPQICSVNYSKKSATKEELDLFIKKGVEKLDKILSHNPFNENYKYLDDEDNCTNSSKKYGSYFFNKADEEAEKEEMKRFLQGESK
ncbi:MAG: hypothetical protein ABIA02_02300 [Candidatus Falkowbacteria bacterium]